MPKPWAEGYDFYFAHLAEKPASIFVDMNAQPHAPLGSHPQLCILYMRMKAPRPDGLRSGEEAPALFKVEDAMLEALRAVDALFLGRIVTDGRNDLVLYTPRGVTAQQVETALAAASGEYRVQVKLKYDPEWLTYLEGLYPTATDRQLMATARVVERLEQAGDDLEAVRELDHFAYFPDAATAQAAAEKLRAAGFRTDAPTPPPEGSAHQMWSLPFHRRDAVTHRRASEVSLEILELLEGTGGHYDGWGCVSVPRAN